MKKIVFKEIPGVTSLDYKAGSDGRIYSRKVYKGFGRTEYVDWYPLVECKTTKGYFCVSLSDKGKKITKSVHKLICLSFHGVPENKSMQVRHLDGVRINNLPGNLKWGTQAENWQDRKIHGHGNTGEKHPMSKLSDEVRGHIRWAIQIGLTSQRQVAIKLGMSQAAIYSICTPKRIRP